MTRNVDIEISISDIFYILKQHWKFVIFIAIIFALLAGSVDFFRSFKEANKPTTEDTIAQEESYNLDLQIYNESLKAASDSLTSLRQEWLNLTKIHNNHPLMSIDPYDCEYEHITLTFSHDSGSHTSLVRDWIGSANDEKLFSKSTKKIRKYKNSLIQVISSESNETEVIIIAVEGFNTTSSLTYLIEYFKSQAEKSSLNLLEVSSSHRQGYLTEIAAFQKGNADAINSICAALKNTKDIDIVFPAPSEPASMAASKSISKKHLAAYTIFGFIIGFVLAIVCIIVSTIIQRKAISRNQIENAFNLALLSDFSHNNKASLDILNANLDVMTHDHSTIMVIDSYENELLGTQISNWTNNSNRNFIRGTSIFDDSETIESLQNVDGLIIGVHLGKSKLDDILRIVLRAEKLNKEVFGYVRL